MQIAKAIEFSVISAQIISRLVEYYGDDQAPEAIRHILSQLPLIAKKVDDLKKRDNSPEVIILINQFQSLITQLDSLTRDINPSKSDSTFRKGKKAFKSFQNENELSNIWPKIETYKSTLTFYYLNIGSEVVNNLHNFPASSLHHFTSRSSIFKEFADNKIIALIGMSGCGKTQLAIEYCKTNQLNGTYSAIFWIDASSTISIEQSFQSYTSLIDPKSNPKNTLAAIKIVKYGLNSFDKPWLIVFDNFNWDMYDNVDDYIPENRNGLVLFTSRNQKGNVYSIDVSEMTEDEGLDLLLCEARCDKNESNVIIGKKILSRVGYLAVAIAQVGVYASSYGLSLDTLLNQLNTHNQEILNEIPHEWDYKKNVFDVCDDEFGAFNNYKGDEKRLLILSSFLNNNDIIEDIFSVYYKEHKCKWMNKFTHDGIWNSNNFENVIKVYHKSGLILNYEKMYNGIMFSIHPLFQDWIKLGLNQEITSTLKEVISIFTIYLDSLDINTLNNSSKQVIISHGLAIQQNEEYILDNGNEQSTIRKKIDILHKESHNESSTNSKQMGFSITPKEVTHLDEKALKRELAELESSLPPDDLHIIETVDQLANLYLSQENYDQARAMEQRVYEYHNNLSGPINNDTLNSLNILAAISSKQGKLEQAITIRQVVLTGREKILGSEHWKTLETIDDLAQDYVGIYNFSKAKSLLKRSLKIREQVLGEDNESTLHNIDDLANVYKQDGSYHTSKSLYEKALKGRESLLGRNHKDTLNTVYELGELYELNMKFERAEIMYERAYNGRKRILGLANRETLKSGHNFANVYKCQKKYKEAKDLYSIILAERYKLLGGDDEDYIDTMMCLGIVHYHLNEFNEAEEMLSKAVQILKRKFRKDNKMTIRAINELSHIKSKKESVNNE